MSSLSPLVATANVAIGGAFGAALRYQAGRALTGWIGAPTVIAFPFPTLIVNALGSLLMGLLAAWLFRGGAEVDQLRLLIGVGLLGGFTTFSAFSYELVVLIERGELLFAGLYAFLSVALGVIGLMAGLFIVRGVS